MLSKIIILLLSLSLSLAALSPTLTKNYFFMANDNHLSYELFQTRNGIVAHTTDVLHQKTFVSRYLLIDLKTKQAQPILTDTVNACETYPGILSRLHNHVPSGSLVYFCAMNSTLLFINQTDYSVQSILRMSVKLNWPVAKLSTEGTSLAILLTDTLFTQYPQDSVLVKIDMQTKQTTSQILLNKNMTTGEAVVAYAAGKKSNYVASNRIEGSDVNTTVFSVIVIGSSYQITPIASFKTSTAPNKIITKLFCLGNLVVVNNGQDIHFLNAQGKIVKTTQAVIRPMTSDSSNGFFHTAVTSQYDNTYLYVQSALASIDKYSVLGDIIQLKQLEGSYGDMKIAYGNTTSGDLAFTIDSSHVLFNVVDIQTSKTVYTAISGYTDLMLTETTYAVLSGFSSLNSHVFVFDLKTDALIAQVPISTANSYYNKDQKMISLINATAPSGCALTHIDLVSGKVWTTLSFADSDPICSSYIVSARLTEKGNPEAVLPFKDHYLIISETYGQLVFEATSAATVNFDNLNVNFDDLSAYYLVSNQDTNQVNASFYTFNYQSKAFQLQSTNIIESAPVESKGFFNVNSTMSVAISSSAFLFIEKLESHFYYPLANNFNLATAFQDAEGTQYVLVASNNVLSTKGSAPQLYASKGGIISLPGYNSNTVSATATGPKSFALHDELSQSVGVVRLYNAGISGSAKTLISV